MAKRISAIVRGKPYFGANGVLYPVGALVPADPGVPEEEVSEDATREKEVEYETRNGDVKTKKVKVRVPFAPVPEGSSASSPKEKEGAKGDKLNVSTFLNKAAGDVVSAVEKGEVDEYLAVLEQGEMSKGKPRETVKTAIKARRDELKI